jgi:hypothetical protein
MNSIETTVLAKVVKEKEAKDARSQVLPGSYPVDFTVRIHGNMKVAEEKQRPATTSVPWLEVTTLYREVFRRAIDDLVAKIDAGSAVTRGDLTSMATAGVLTTDVLVECIKKALENKESAVGTIKDKVEEVDAGVKRLQEDIIAKTPKQRVSGNVSLSVEVETVGVPQGMTAAEVAEAIARQAVPQTV